MRLVVQRRLGNLRRKAVLLAMANYADDRTGGRIFPSVDTLAESADCSPRAVHLCLAEFRREGLISCDGEHRSGVKSWRIHVEKLSGYPTVQGAFERRSALHLMQTDSAQDADPALHEVQSAPAPDADYNINEYSNLTKPAIKATAAKRKARSRSTQRSVEEQAFLLRKYIEEESREKDISSPPAEETPHESVKNSA